MKPEEKEIQKIDEEVLNELESTEVSGGVEKMALADNNGGFQCTCQNYQCGKKFSDTL